MNYKVSTPSKTYDVTISEIDGRHRVHISDGKESDTLDVDFKSAGAGSLFSMLVGHESFRMIIQKDRAGHAVFTRGHRFQLTVEDERTFLMRSLINNKSASGGGEVKAPIPGLVTKILAAEGDNVTQGQGVLILEAMKMENEIKSPVPGNITRITAQQGRNVEKGEILFIVG